MVLSFTGKAGGAVAQSRHDSPAKFADSTAQITFFFRTYETTIDASYMTNGESIKRIAGIIMPANSLEISRVEVAATASPEGSAALNRKLATQRADALEELVRGWMDFDPAKIVRSEAVHPWASLRSRVEQDIAVPNRAGLLALLNDTNAQDEAVRGWKIRMLGGGATYKYLKEHALPAMRTGTITLTLRRPADPVPARDSVRKEAPAPVAPEVTPPAKDSVAVAVPQTPVRKTYRKVRTMNLALTSNLPFDLAGAPNLGVEVPLGKRFSVAGNAVYAYWQIDNRYALQTLHGGLEGKYWFNPSRGPLTGWNVGLYGMYGGRYDVQWKDGYQGDGFWSAGVSAGWAMPVSKRLNLEFGLSGGYFFTPEVRHYHAPREGHLMWEETRYNTGRFSLTGANINLVWFFGKK